MGRRGRRATRVSADGAAVGSGVLAPGQRWSATRKRDVVLRLLRGESLEAVSQEVGFEVYRLEPRSRECPQARADPGGRLQHRTAPAPPDRRRYAPEPAGAGCFGDLPLDRASDRPLGASEARLGVQMDPDGARRLNRSSPSCLNSGAQRTDFFHGL